MQILIIYDDADRTEAFIEEVILVPEDDVETIKERIKKFRSLRRSSSLEYMNLSCEFRKRNRQPLPPMNPRDYEEYEKKIKDYYNRQKQYIDKRKKIKRPMLQKFLQDSGADVQFMSWREI